MSVFQIYDLVVTSGKAIIPDSVGIIVGTADDEYKNFPVVEPGAYDDCWIVDFGEDIGTCTVHKDDMTHYCGDVGDTGKIVVGRAINGISINGLEFLLNDQGQPMEFQSINEAIQFLFANEISTEEIIEMTFSNAKVQ